MAERTPYKECAECGKLYDRSQIEAIPDGYGSRRIPGPKSPLGWSKVSQRRKVSFLITRSVCHNCLGYTSGRPEPKSEASFAAAAGFKRFTPPTR